MPENSFDARATLQVGDRALEIFRLDALQSKFDVARLPFSLKILLENLLRTEGNGVRRRPPTSRRSRRGTPKAEPSKEIAFTPARVVMQDFTGVPAVVDLAAMRDAMADARRRPGEDQPARPGRARHRPLRAGRRLRHRATRSRATPSASSSATRSATPFLRWGQDAFDNFAVVPPDTGIVHQVNLEYLARVVFVDDESGTAYPDTLVGTDSHTTMINGLGVLGWGVGGIEAEAAMLGQPMSMLIPQVLGFKLTRRAARGRDGDRPRPDRHRDAARARRRRASSSSSTARASRNLPLADRATIGNMSPEFGSTCAIFPIDAETLRYLAFSGRPKEHIDARRGVRQGAGPVARRGRRGADVLRHDRARPRRGRAVARRARSARRTASSLDRGARPSSARRCRTTCPRTSTHRTSSRRRGRRGLVAVVPGVATRRRRPSRSTATARATAARSPRATHDHSARRRPPVDATVPVTLDDGTRDRARPRPRRHRRDHELHEHLEPVGHARRRPARAQRRRARA